MASGTPPSAHHERHCLATIFRQFGDSKLLLCRSGSPARRAERDVAADALAGYSRGVVLDKTEGQAKLAPAEKCAPAAGHATACVL